MEKSNEILKQFAYASAHDLKEPLRSINSFVSIINNRYAKLLPPEACEYMNFVIVGVKKMESLISALLEYSTIATDEANHKQATSLSNVLRELNNCFYSDILETNAVIELNGYFPTLKISRLHLSKLFQNLVSNAFKFNNKNPIIQIVGKLENDNYIVEVKDNGIGMKVEYNDKIFRLFQIELSLHIYQLFAYILLSQSLFLHIEMSDSIFEIDGRFYRCILLSYLYHCL